MNPCMTERLEDRRLLSAYVFTPIPQSPPDPLAISQQLHVKSLLNQLAPPQINANTVPANGDQNPYGVAFVPLGFPRGGLVHPGDILVSNFNDSTALGNQQGTGRTIVSIAPDGTQSLFFQGQPGLGLTTALGVLRRGFVIVGNVPTTDGTPATLQPTSLLVLDKNGNVVLTLSDSKLLNGPWDLAVHDEGSRAVVFVSNVLSGTVTRIVLAVPRFGSDVDVLSMKQIASGYLTRTDPAALLVGPTGLAYDALHDRLYVASTGDNAIYAISDAGDRTSDAGLGKLVYKDDAHLRGPLGLVLTPAGTLIAANGDAVNGDPNHPSELIEFTPGGTFVSSRSVDTTAQGGAFGIAIATVGDKVRFAAVDDVTNTLEVWTVDV